MMPVRKKLTVLVEALTSYGDSVHLFDQEVDESDARQKMAAALNDVRALDFCEDEGSIVVSLQNEEIDEDDPDSMESEFVQFAAEDAVQALHKHFDWDRAALRQALAVERVTRLIEDQKGQRVAANDRHHEAHYELMAFLNLVHTIDKRRFH